MLITLLAWIYITFLCWMWGILFLQFIKKIFRSELQFPHFSIICITGLSAITVLAGFLSLLIPLGKWWVQFLFILPCLTLFFKKDPPAFFAALKKEFQGLHLLSIILLSASLLLLLVLSTWTIVHPDTLGYHAQTIQWIEKYKAVPGLVHLHVRFGYQGLWFVDAALFGFSFTGNQGITLLNSTVLFWFFIFIVDRTNQNFFKGGKKLYGLFWIALFFISMWSYTQVRLTATSASPDFIAALFVWAIIYLLLEKNLEHLSVTDWLLVAFLSLVAVTIKLSVAPILLIAAVPALLGLVKRKIKLFFSILIISAVTLSPFVARNIITSGYVVFPSTFIDVANIDWKYSPQLTANEKDYITAYAKRPGVTTTDEIKAANKMSIAEWLPNWWQNRSTADKVIMMLLLLAFIATLLAIKKVVRSGFIPIVVLLTLFSGIIFCLINAPDPRFGFGSILGFIAVSVYLLFKEKEIFIGKNIVIAILFISSASVFAYTGYRFINFFNKKQFLSPLGIERPEYKTVDCDGIKINSPLENREFGITPVPCTDLDCEKFSPRGGEIKDGFKAK
ncbi:MAG TPA: hypothetical protein VFZ33_12480 [Chitinophagaceae bacterium]